jgi:hypothetical protein
MPLNLKSGSIQKTVDVIQSVSLTLILKSLFLGPWPDWDCRKILLRRFELLLASHNPSLQSCLFS